MSISRTLMVLAVAAAPLAAQAQTHADPVPAGDVPTVFRPTVEKDSLWTLVAPTVAAGRVTPSQAMVALLRQNPQAFVRGNLHLLRRGVALTMPTLAQIRAENRAKAAELVEAHLQLLKQGQAAPAPYELGALPSAAAAAPRGAASGPAVRAPVAAASAASAVVPRLAASKPEARASAAGPAAPVKAASASAAPVKPAASKPEPAAVKAAASAAPPASAVAPVTPAPSLASAAPQPASQAEAPASKPAVARAPVEAAPSAAASQPQAEPALATEVETASSSQLLGYGLGLLLLGGAAGGAWWWRARRPAPSSGKTERRERELPDLPSMRQPEVQTEAVETVRSLDAMQSALELVRPADQPEKAVPDLAADTALKLELARAYIELRRHDEAYVLLQFVVRHGTEVQQQEAAELLRGSA